MQLLPKDSYFAMIRNSVGAGTYRSLYADIDGKKTDILRDGELSCAFYVSSILSSSNFKLLPAAHATVEGLMRGLAAAGWQKVEHPTHEGEVIVWEHAKQAEGEDHLHAGFFVGGEQAISHLDSTRTPQEHLYTFGVKEDGSPARAIIAVYTHPFLA